MQSNTKVNIDFSIGSMNFESAAEIDIKVYITIQSRIVQIITNHGPDIMTKSFWLQSGLRELPRNWNPKRF